MSSFPLEVALPLRLERADAARTLIHSDPQLLPIVSLGLTGSDLYASLSPEEGVEHCKRKLHLLDA